MGHYRLLEHTADIGIEATAERREGLVEQCGHGLNFLLYDALEVSGGISRRISASGATPEETLVNWLNELLFTLVDQNLVAAGLTIRHFNENEIVAEISGEHLDPDRHQMLREIKAVTHHQTEVAHNGDHWHARVYLDL